MILLLRNRSRSYTLTVAPVALLVLALAFWLGQRASLRWLVLIAGGIGGIVLLMRPSLGLFVLIPAALIAPLEIGTGTQTGLNAAVLLLPLLLGLWVVEMARRKDLRLLPSRPISPLLALCGAAILALAVGNLPWFLFAQTAPLRAQLGGLAVFLLSAGAFLLVAHQVRDLRWLQALTWLFLALGGLYMAGRLAPGLGRFTLRLFRQGATGGLFWTWLVAVAFSQAVFNSKLHLLWRLALGGLALATLYVGLFQGRSWASGWLPPLAAVAAVLWAGAPRLRAPVGLVAGTVFAFGWQRIIAVVMSNQEYSFMTRLEAWRIISEIIKVNPLLGLGPANYYYYTPLFPILGYYVVFSSHNQYVDLVAQTGLLGLACFLWFAWEVGRLGWRLRTRAPAGFAQAYVYGALGGLAGTLAAGVLADWILPFVYNIGLAGFRASILGWIFLGGLVALENMSASHEERS